MGNQCEEIRAERKRRRRKSWLIYPKFQVVLLVVNIITIISTLGIIEYQVLKFFDHMKLLGQKAGFGEFHAYFKFIELQKDTIVSNLLVALIAGVIVSTAIYLLLSHKVSGPIVRLMSFFNEINETGEIKHLSFRKNDFFRELPPLINEALLTVKDKSNQG